VYGESICCLLLNGSRHQRKNENSCNAKHTHDKNRKKKSSMMASDVENKLRTIRERLAGYRYLTVQDWARPITYDFELIFRTVFRGDSGELWLYGQRRPLPSPRERVSVAIGFGCNRETHCTKEKSNYCCPETHYYRTYSILLNCIKQFLKCGFVSFRPESNFILFKLRFLEFSYYFDFLHRFTLSCDDT